MLQQQKCLVTTNAQQYHNEQQQPSADATVRRRAISLPQHVASERGLQQQQQPQPTRPADHRRATWITASAAKQRQQHVAAALATQTPHKRTSAGWHWPESNKSKRARHNVPDVAATLAPHTECNENDRAAAQPPQSQIAQVATDDRNAEWPRTADNMPPPHCNMLKAAKAKMFGLKFLSTLEADVAAAASVTSAAQFVAAHVLPVAADGGNMQNHNNNNNKHSNTVADSSHHNNIGNNNNSSSSSSNTCTLSLQENTEKTIDFNSRRRRGRLRFAAGRVHVAATCVRNVASYALALLLLLLSLLLSLIVGYVNMIARLVITQTAAKCRKNRAGNGYSDGDANGGNNNCKSNTHSKNPKAQYALSSTEDALPNATPPGQAACVAAVIAADALTDTAANSSTVAATEIAAINDRDECRRRRRTKLTAAAAVFSSSGSGKSGGSNMQLIYAFILCTSILLPCGHNLVAAAKPKSATQLQQQKQQHDLLQQQQQQQQQQHQHQQHHHPGQAGQQLQPQSHQPAGINMAYDGVSGGVLTPPTYQVVSSQTSNEESELLYASSQSEERFDEEEQNLNDLDEESENAAYETQVNETHLDQVNVTKTPLFPKDLFSKEQLENGAVACHIIGVIYMFVALAIVCDEFFVPSLDVIIEKLDITDDVAGATFMAAGGSAPELFTSVIGVFISFDDVGIGTIVGSAVFNILFVIGMCALFSKTVLTLTWWPLFRDCSFYSISLLVLIYFFRDNFIFWWEALILFSIYIAYVTFMKWNVQVERCVKKVITKNKVTRVRSTDQLMPAGNAANSSETSMATQPGGSVTSRAASETRSGPPGSSSGGAGATGNSSGTAGSTHTGAKFRHGLLQLMIHTIDPLHDDDVPGKVDEKATQLHAIASLKVLLDATKPQRGGATTSAANHVKINLKETTLADRPNGNIDTTLDSADVIEDEPEPLSMAWPDTARKRLTYILVAPLLIPMWLTLPDTRTPRGKKYFPITFIGSILWIAAFSYLMVWWANVAGDTARIPPEVMGLTFLAAGTSIPDLITSVIVARKGFGDMAVSSSVGSNIFDVTVGLPIPWLLFGIIYDAPVEVNSVGMVCSITILFMMLVFVVISIACFRWRMNKGLGFTMFLLYFVFVAVSLMFEYDTISCPV